GHLCLHPLSLHGALPIFRIEPVPISSFIFRFSLPWHTRGTASIRPLSFSITIPAAGSLNGEAPTQSASATATFSANADRASNGRSEEHTSELQSRDNLVC